MSKFSKIVALFLLTVMTVSLVPENVFAEDGIQAEVDKAFISSEDEDSTETSATEEPKEKPSENTDKEPEETPAETTGEEPEKTPEETPSKSREEEPTEKPSDNDQKTPSRNSTEDPVDADPSEEPKQEPETTQPADSIPVVEGTWDEADGKKIFLDDSGKRVTGFCKISDKIYFFDEEGIMKTGWITMTDGTRRYFGSDGAAVVDSWKTVGKVRYHFDENGIMATGLKKIGGKIYFFDSKGKIKKGWVTTGGKKYYFDKNGVAYTNRWLTKKKKKYHFDSEGVMAKGLTRIGNSLYFFNSKGQMKKGWVTTGGKKYYFGKKGKAYLNRWLTKKKKKYHFDSEGVMAKGLTFIGNNLYFFNSKGQMKKGWVTTGGKKYYFDKKGKAYINRWLKYKKKKYYFNSEGAMSSGPMVIGGQLYFFDSNGKLKTGWVTINGVRRYFDKNGKAYVNKWLTYNKHKYYFNSEGVPVTDLQIIDNHIYYFDSTGMMKTGWMTIDGVKYYFRSSGAAATGGWYWIGEDRYYFGVEGNMYHDTIIDGIEIGPDGRAIIMEDDDDPEDDPINIYDLVLLASLVKGDSIITNTYGYISGHILGYNDPAKYSGKVEVSGWTYVAMKSTNSSEYKYLKTEDFDLEKFHSGAYGCDTAWFCCLPGEKVTLKVIPSEEYCDFLGWSYTTRDVNDRKYDKSKIISTDKTITVTVEESKILYAHCNSPWTGCHVDYRVTNSDSYTKPKCSTIVRNLTCIRGTDGSWVLDSESCDIKACAAFYSVFMAYSGSYYPSSYNPNFRNFFMRDENWSFTTKDIYIEIEIDEYGKESGAIYYIAEYEQNTQSFAMSLFVLKDKDGNIRYRTIYEGDGYFWKVDPYTGEYLEQYYNAELARLIDKDFTG